MVALDIPLGQKVHTGVAHLRIFLPVPVLVGPNASGAPGAPPSKRWVDLLEGAENHSQFTVVWPQMFNA